MKQFLVKCIWTCLPLLLVLYSIGFLADGYTDEYYLKFTSTRQSAMIIGTSKAAHGLRPDILDRELKTTYPGIDIYNFAFTLDVSPFGKVYFDAISNKLIQNTTGGVFIVSVDPWTISAKNTGDTTQFTEDSSLLGKVKWVNMHPNFFYLTRNYRLSYLSLLTRKIQTGIQHQYPWYRVHENGWLETFPPTGSASVARGLQFSLNLYEKKYLPSWKVSAIRKSWFVKTIAFLQQHGDVYLVRLPVHPSLLAIDNRLYPGFDAYIDSLSRQLKMPYFNFSDSCNKYSYSDGVHLQAKSGALVSEQLGALINDYRHSR